MPRRASKRRRGEEEEEKSAPMTAESRNDDWILPRNRTTPEQREKLCGGASAAL